MPFHPFNRLPVELRSMVWKHALTPPESNGLLFNTYSMNWWLDTIDRRTDEPRTAHIQPVATPVLLRVNAEAREVALAWVEAQGWSLTMAMGFGYMEIVDAVLTDWADGLAYIRGEPGLDGSYIAKLKKMRAFPSTAFKQAAPLMISRPWDSERDALYVPFQHFETFVGDLDEETLRRIRLNGLGNPDEPYDDYDVEDPKSIPQGQPQGALAVRHLIVDVRTSEVFMYRFSRMLHGLPRLKTLYINTGEVIPAIPFPGDAQADSNWDKSTEGGSESEGGYESDASEDEPLSSEQKAALAVKLRADGQEAIALMIDQDLAGEPPFGTDEEEEEEEDDPFIYGGALNPATPPEVAHAWRRAKRDAMRTHYPRTVTTYLHRRGLGHRMEIKIQGTDQVEADKKLSEDAEAAPQTNNSGMKDVSEEEQESGKKHVSGGKDQPGVNDGFGAKRNYEERDEDEDDDDADDDEDDDEDDDVPEEELLTDIYNHLAFDEDCPDHLIDPQTGDINLDMHIVRLSRLAT